MKILHTSDWHLGRTLCGRRRHEEFAAFLEWLAGIIEAHAIDALLVAGDLFDTSTPGNPAQALYYRFLCRVAASPCRHVVVVAGNHDSPAFLEAPRELLKALDVHVVGAACEDPADEVLVLHDAAGAPELIVCAVPYLRERDIRQVTPGESVRDKERKLLEGVRGHYAAVADAALLRREALAAEVPIVGMGHLFTAGGETVEGDGVRDLYVGSLAHVSPGILPACFDYLALGHLHLPQTVNGRDNARYSGSPLAMGFGEACQSKSLCLVELNAAGARVQLIGVPVFRRLERVRGDWEAVSARIGELAGGGFDGWVEVVYEGGEVVGGLWRRLDEMTEGRPLEILRVRNTRLTEQVLSPLHESETLGDLDVDEVFRRCLDLHEVPGPQRPELTRAYRETLAALAEEGWDGSAGGEGR